MLPTLAASRSDLALLTNSIMQILCYLREQLDPRELMFNARKFLDIVYYMILYLFIYYIWSVFQQFIPTSI